jgi:hypothetical protein
MPPLTLAILASVLQMQGADATIASDNKGVDDLLMDIRGQLQSQVDPNAPRVILANYTKTNYSKGGYGKGYNRSFEKDYSRWINATPPSNPGIKPAPGTQPPIGARRRS